MKLGYKIYTYKSKDVNINIQNDIDDHNKYLVLKHALYNDIHINVHKYRYISINPVLDSIDKIKNIYNKENIVLLIAIFIKSTFKFNMNKKMQKKLTKSADMD